MKNILITSAGRRVSLVKAFKKEAAKLEEKIAVICCDAQPILSAACQVADGNFGVPRLDDPNYCDYLVQQCLERDVKLIIPTIDTELLLLAKNKALFQANGITPVVSSLELIRITRDKRKTHDFFRKYDIGVATEYDRENYILPMFLKPYNGSRSVNTYTIRHKKELREKHLKDDTLMFLEYLDHNEHDEYTCDLYYDRSHQLRCVVPRKRIAVRDGEVNKGLTCRNEVAQMIRKKLGFIEGAVGCLTAQFFMHKTTGKITGIEINARFGGGYPLSYLAGANYPGWILKEYILEENIGDHFDEWEDNLLMLRYDDEVLLHGYQDT